MREPRGHSNVHVSGISRYSETSNDIAKIPIEGGVDVYSVTPLPPLALAREEWEKIGQAMGWVLGGVTRHKGERNETDGG
jgi:hypothetical protein